MFVVHNQKASGSPPFPADLSSLSNTSQHRYRKTCTSISHSNSDVTLAKHNIIVLPSKESNMGSTVDDHELADPKLLEKIDQLFELNIGEYVDLPQVRACCIQIWLEDTDLPLASRCRRSVKVRKGLSHIHNFVDVVGGSGKSSVLEGLTGLPFPRDSGLCTRFATQITFRRALETKTTVSIIPAADAKVQHAEKLRSWRKDSLKSLDSETFVQVLKEVSRSI